MWKTYLESVYSVSEVSAANSNAGVAAMSSACWFVVLGGRDFASMVFVRDTTAYPASRCPLCVKELPSVNHVWLGWSKGPSVMWVGQGRRDSRISVQLCRGGC